MKRIYLFGFFFLSFFFKGFIETFKDDTIESDLFSLLGWAAGLVMWPYLLTLLVKWIAKGVNFDFSDKAFIKSFVIFWVMFSLTAFV